MKNFVIKGQICYSLSPKEIATYENSYVVCKDGKSCGVFHTVPEEYREFPVYDYGDCLVLPGCVDLHIHAPQYTYRGTGMDLELMEWLNTYAFPEEAKYRDNEYAKKAYQIFAGQMRKSATTRACIFGTLHKEATQILMELMEKSGLVTYVGKVNMDRNCPDYYRERDAKSGARVTTEWINQVRMRYKRTKPILTPRFVPACSDELMDKLHDIQSCYDLPVQSHLSENKKEIELVKKLCPESRFYGEAYDRYGLFGKNKEKECDVKTVMAHCVWPEEEEMKLLKENGVFVAHCPSSNMNLASGIAPVRKFLDMGIRVGLGSDVAAGESESIFQAMKSAIQVSKLYHRPITFPESFYMATRGGGEFFGKVGSFEAGYEMDAIIIDDSIHPFLREEFTIGERVERAVYLSLDMNGLCGKYVKGEKLF